MVIYIFFLYTEDIVERRFTHAIVEYDEKESFRCLPQDIRDESNSSVLQLPRACSVESVDILNNTELSIVKGLLYSCTTNKQFFFNVFPVNCIHNLCYINLLIQKHKICLILQFSFYIRCLK